MWWLSGRKTTVRESGLLEGFCDYHSHLLPGVDDGVEQLSESLEILEVWQEAGISDVWLTPHIMEDYPNETAQLRERFETLQTAWQGSISLHLAAEHMMDGLFVRRLAAGDLMPLGSSGRRVLVETSYYIPPFNMEQLIAQIKQKGYEPILAHPERYQYMGGNDYRHWRDEGVGMQLNVPSLVGAYGPEVEHKAKWLLNEGLYDCCGTDTHSIRQQDFFLDSLISRNTVRKVRRIIDN